MKNKNKIKPVFNVIIYNFNNDTFEPYDVIGRLERSWEICKKRKAFIYRDENTGETKLTKKVTDIKNNDKRLKEWVDGELRYMFWSKCEYEMILQGWPTSKEGKKVDIYWQCSMNIDLIVKLFREII